MSYGRIFSFFTWYLYRLLVFRLDIKDYDIEIVVMNDPALLSFCIIMYQCCLLVCCKILPWNCEIECNLFSICVSTFSGHEKLVMLFSDYNIAANLFHMLWFCIWPLSKDQSLCWSEIWQQKHATDVVGILGISLVSH